MERMVFDNSNLEEDCEIAENLINRVLEGRSI